MFTMDWNVTFSGISWTWWFIGDLCWRFEQPFYGSFNHRTKGSDEWTGKTTFHRKGFHAFSRLEHRSGRFFTGLNFLHLALNLPGNQTWHWEIPSINGDFAGKDINKCTFSRQRVDIPQSIQSFSTNPRITSLALKRLGSSHVGRQ